MAKLVMIMNKYGRFVGEEPTKKEEEDITLKDAVQMMDMMGQQGPMVSGAILGDMIISEHDIVVYLDEKSTYYTVYHQCVSGLVLDCSMPTEENGPGSNIPPIH